MNHKEFDKLLEERFNKIRSTLASKNKEYASGDDKLHNFKRAGNMLGCTQEKALIGMWTKHIISILDIVDKWENENESPNTAQLDEKIGDAINYLILLEASFKERLSLIKTLYEILTENDIGKTGLD
jgi:hypothetical protein